MGQHTSPELLDRFLDAMWSEQGLARNTLAAYGADLRLLERWLGKRGKELTEAGKPDLLAFIGDRTADGIHARTLSRQLSTARRFYGYLVREGLIDRDPSAQIAAPRTGRPLPHSLTESEVESLLAAPLLSDPLGVRDRCMLEVLYATGLRVSELVNLSLGQLNLANGVLRVEGKGSKERLVPLGEEAADWVRNFLDGARGEILGERVSNALFPTRRGAAMTWRYFATRRERPAAPRERCSATKIFCGPMRPLPRSTRFTTAITMSACCPWAGSRSTCGGLRRIACTAWL